MLGHQGTFVLQNKIALPCYGPAMQIILYFVIKALRVSHNVLTACLSSTGRERVQTEKDFRTLLTRAKAAWYGSDEVRELDGAMKDRFGSCVVDDEAHSIRSPETKSNDCLAILHARVYLLVSTTVFPNRLPDDPRIFSPNPGPGLQRALEKGRTLQFRFRFLSRWSWHTIPSSQDIAEGVYG